MTVTLTDHTGKQQSFPLVVEEVSTGSLSRNLSAQDWFFGFACATSLFSEFLTSKADLR